MTPISPLHNLDVIVSSWNHSFTGKLQWHTWSEFENVTQVSLEYFFLEMFLSKGQAFQMDVSCCLFLYLFLISFGWKCKLDRWRETWMAKWRAAAVTLPSGNPAIILSGHIDLRERVKKTEMERESWREMWGVMVAGMKTQKGIMFLSKSGWFGFYHARWHFSNALVLALAFQINKSL